MLEKTFHRLPGIRHKQADLGGLTQRHAMGSLTRSLGRFVSNLTLLAVPAAGCATAKIGIIDCIGVLVAGARDPVVGLIDRELSGADGKEMARLLPSGKRRNAEDAALTNGVAAHVLDYDDVTLDGHPSAILVPAIMAQGEVSGSTGEELLAAYIAGYEVWAELLIREPTPLHTKGWHPTAMRGTVAASAACSKLRRLNELQTATALAISASMASGVVANFGTLTKPFQVGRAAQAGLIAARLADAGLTAATDALEHPAGFLAALSPVANADRDRPFNDPVATWHIIRQGLNLKRYPVCYGAHRAIDATLDLVQKHDLRPDDVSRVRVSTGAAQMIMLRNSHPRTVLEAKFSMQFAIASAIVARAVGLAQLTDDFVNAAPVQSLFDRISCDVTSETMDGSVFAPSETVEINTTSGRELKSEHIVYAKGSFQRPLSRTELWDKFSDCLGDSIAAKNKTRWFEELTQLEAVKSAHDLLVS